MLPSPVTFRAVRRAAFARSLGRAVSPFLAICIAALLLVLFAACCLPVRRSDTMRIQCPESPRTYCPAQHDTAKVRRFPGDTLGGRR